MKILLVTPSPPELYRGSAATVRRFRDGLQRRGHLCEVFGCTQEGGLKQSLEGTIGRFKPDLVHAYDARRTGLGLMGLRLPWVISMGGQDFYRDMVSDEGAMVCEVFGRAHRVLVPHEGAARAMEERVPNTVGKIDVVPRGVAQLPTHGTDLRRSLGIPRQRFLVLLPGGLRPLKAQHRAMSLPRLLRSAGVDAQMIIVGPEQDPEYARGLVSGAGADPGVRILPALSWERMGAAYADADVVLNTSLDEGMSSSILEAGSLGRPVVASRVPGNEALISHKETGLLFDDEESMTKSVLAVARNRSAAGALGVRMKEDFKRRFDPDLEIDRLLSAYAAA